MPVKYTSFELSCHHEATVASSALNRLRKA
jgi:hypothetical protein